MPPPISRREVLRRARSWHGLTYSMSPPLHRGYRRDCSGYVSMCLNIDPDDGFGGLNTVTLARHLVRIGRDRLRPGDLVGACGPGTAGAAGHVVIFEKWLDTGHTRYRGFEFGRTPGPDHHPIPYPYFPGDGRRFLAYRYRHILDDAGVAPSPGARPPNPPDPPSPRDGGRPARRYTVRPGDTLSSIAARMYGDPAAWRRIFAANRETIGPDPDRIVPGQRLRVPGAPAHPRTHVVRPGESLSSIAALVYGDPTGWPRIFAANRRLIGPDPDRLRPGQRLRIP